MSRLLTALAALACSACATTAPPPAFSPPPFSSAATARANTEAALASIRRLNPSVNAVIAVDPTAMEQAAHAVERFDHGVEAVGVFSKQALGPANGLRRIRHLRGT